MLISDINECKINNGGCQQICTNVFGSYLCTCNNGYNLMIDGHSCLGLKITYSLKLSLYL